LSLFFLQGGKTVFELVEVTKKYRNHEALKQLRFVIEPGVTAVVGPNGAGKTTLFNILTGRIFPTCGTVFYNGQPVEKIRGNLGYLFEDPPFYPYLTAENQLGYFNALREYPVEAHEVERELEKWDIPPKGKKIKDFSQGMRKRLGLANAFLGNPQIVILDEPFNGLDLEGQQLLEDTFVTYRSKDRFLIFSSHQLERITLLADRIVILDQGRLVYTGETKELAEQATKVIFYLPGDISMDLLRTPLVLEIGKRGVWVTAAVQKEKGPLFLQHLAEHGIVPQSSRLLISELEYVFEEKQVSRRLPY
jgi:ABC-2 type transport system ATP-binding protein